MASASTTGNNFIIFDILNSKELPKESAKAFKLTNGTIMNKFLVTTKLGNIPCMYRQPLRPIVFIPKIEDKRGEISANFNLLMMPHRSEEHFDASNTRLPIEIINHIAMDFFGCVEPKMNYMPDDFAPNYELVYKGKLPELISQDDMMTLYKTGVVDIARRLGNSYEYYVHSDEAFDYTQGLVHKYWDTREKMQNAILICLETEGLIEPEYFN